MITVKRKTVLDLARAVGAMLFILTPLLAAAQAAPAMRGPLTLHLLGTATYGSFNSGTNSYGYSLGGFVQTSHLWGLEVRGAYLRWGSAESRFDTMIGPRVAFHYGRFSSYGDVLVGVGHPLARLNGPKSTLVSSTGAEVKLLGGVDYYATHHLSIRLGEISFAEYYALPKSLSAIDFSGGFVYHIPVRER
jgi:hypothetical protein